MEPGDGGGRVAVHSAVEGDRGWGGHLLVCCDGSHIRSNYMRQDIMKGFLRTLIKDKIYALEIATHHL